MDRVRSGVDVVRIDEESLRQLSGGAREATEDQHPAAVVAHRHELLRDQVHAVMEGRHHAEVGMAIEGPDLRSVDMPIDVDDRAPVAGPDSLIDLIDGAAHLRLELTVTGDAAAARRRALNEHHPLAVLGIALEESS